MLRALCAMHQKIKMCSHIFCYFSITFQSKPYFCTMGKKRTEKIVFENVQILDAGAKGVSVAKAPDGCLYL